MGPIYLPKAFSDVLYTHLNCYINYYRYKYIFAKSSIYNNTLHDLVFD